MVAVMTADAVAEATEATAVVAVTEAAAAAATKAALHQKNPVKGKMRQEGMIP
jgi:mRNA-degrading endonuclease toxin of MazEF toxin-antitoxin module